MIRRIQSAALAARQATEQEAQRIALRRFALRKRLEWLVQWADAAIEAKDWPAFARYRREVEVCARELGLADDASDAMAAARQVTDGIYEAAQAASDDAGVPAPTHNGD